MKQTRPFSVQILTQDKLRLLEDSLRFGVHYGIFFDTSGQAHTERINPNAKYDYLWRTDRKDEP